MSPLLFKHVLKKKSLLQFEVKEVEVLLKSSYEQMVISQMFCDSQEVVHMSHTMLVQNLKISLALSFEFAVEAT